MSWSLLIASGIATPVSCPVFGFLISAISIGPSVNSPASAFRVSSRRYPPALVIAAPFCRIAATTIAAGISPMTDCAASQALGLIPSIERTTAATQRKSRQLEMPPLA